MRGIIIEKKWHSAIVMTQNGQFRRLYFPFGKEVADEVFLQRQLSLRFAVAAMAVFFLVTGLVGYNTLFQATAYGFVSIEVNPAAEFQINKYGVVVDAVPLNGEANEILSEINYRWRSIEKVSADYVGQTLAAGFIDRPEEARIFVTISGVEGADTEELSQRLATIEAAQKNRLEKMAVPAETDYRQVTPEVRREASALGVATGTWERIQKGEEMTYTHFELEIGSGDDDKLEVAYQQETHNFEAEVEWELRDAEWKHEGARALEYLLPIFRRLELDPGMSQNEMIQRVVTAFEWSAEVTEFSLTTVLTDGSRINFEWNRNSTTPLPTPAPISVEDDDDDDDDDDFEDIDDADNDDDDDDFEDIDDADNDDDDDDFEDIDDDWDKDDDDDWDKDDDDDDDD